MGRMGAQSCGAREKSEFIALGLMIVVQVKACILPVLVHHLAVVHHLIGRTWVPVLKYPYPVAVCARNGLAVGGQRCALRQRYALRVFGGVYTEHD